MANNIAPALLEQRLSTERFAPYRAACAGDLDRAVVLYEWNAHLAAAFWRTLGHVEIALRNAMHAELTAWSSATQGSPAWYRDTGAVLSREARSDVLAAMRRAGRGGRPSTAGRVVAELSFGFWRYLLAAKYDRTLWRSCLHRAFAGSSGSRREVYEVVARLHTLRNRIAHHEPIHNRPVDHAHADAMTLVEWICPDTGDWIAAGCGVPALLGERPR